MLRTHLDTPQTLAEQQYEAIRALRSDIDTVAQNAGLSVAEVTTMKKHLFFGKHERFAPEVGKVVRKRFDANDEISEAWIRAQNGPLNARQQEWFGKLAETWRLDFPSSEWCSLRRVPPRP